MPIDICQSSWASMFTSLSGSSPEWAKLAESARVNPGPTMLFLLLLIALVYVAAWACFSFLPTHLLAVFGPSVWLGLSIRQANEGHGTFILILVAVVVLLYLVRLRLTAVFLQPIISLSAAASGMPGVAFHLAWCVLMIPVVKYHWVQIEKKKEKEISGARERGEPVDVDDSPPSTFRRDIGGVVWFLAVMGLIIMWGNGVQSDGEAVVRLYFTSMVVSSVIALLVYWSDKKKAQADGWRTPERDLHFWEMLGGWPGAMVAREVFRHKYKKRSFLIQSRYIIFCHCSLLFLAFAMSDRQFRQGFEPLLNVAGKCEIPILQFETKQ